MFCPNDNADLRQATVPSHYGQKVIIDQCGSCGGIWFDAFELYKVKQGEAESIEMIDSDILRATSHIDKPPLLCPRDQTALVQFNDPQFPKDLVLTRCPKCQGFWLNRGVFTEYQVNRQKSKPPKEKTLEDLELEANVQRLLQAHREGSSHDVLGRAGKFLSAPVTPNTLFPQASGAGSSPAESTVDTIVSVLLLLMRLFVFRS
jgi:Zn-finger nucleic acid-binding protein